MNETPIYEGRPLKKDDPLSDVDNWVRVPRSRYSGIIVTYGIRVNGNMPRPATKEDAFLHSDNPPVRIQVPTLGYGKYWHTFNDLCHAL